MSARNLQASRGWRWTGYVKLSHCERCGARSRLVVHHKDRDPSNNIDHSNLETLCRACHAAEHTSEIAVSQRREDVNQRRGAAISRAKLGKVYPNNVQAVKDKWADPDYHAKMSAIHSSAQTSKRHSEVAKRLMNDPAHIAKRRAMKEARRAST